MPALSFKGWVLGGEAPAGPQLGGGYQPGVESIWLLFCKLAFVCKVHLKYIKPLLTPAVPYLGPTQVGVWKQKARPPDEKKGLLL